MDARYETSIEVSINCKSINEDIWGEMYDLLFNYTNDLPRGKNDLFSTRTTHRFGCLRIRYL